MERKHYSGAMKDIANTGKAYVVHRSHKSRKQQISA